MHTSSTPVATIFNHELLAQHRNRAANNFAAHDFLIDEMAERLAERLDEFGRDFPVVLDIGCHSGQVAKHLTGRYGITTFIQSDISASMLAQAKGLCIRCNDETLPFAPASFDLISSVLNLHWVNDLPGTLIQIRRALKPGGIFIASLFGGCTLTELRQVLFAEEIASNLGTSPHISPFVDSRDAAALLQRAGFAMPVIDSDILSVTYTDAITLCRDLRGMGESNALMTKNNCYLGKQFFPSVAARYSELFPADAGRIKASFEMITLAAMAP